MVVGAGDATVSAVARRFAGEGYIACMTRRSADKLASLVAQIRAEGGEAHAFTSDARKEEEAVSLIERIERDIAAIEVAVFNIGANVRFTITETTACVDQNSILAPDHIAEACWQIHRQPRDAWTHKTELRPLEHQHFLLATKYYFGKDRLQDMELSIAGQHR